MTVEAEETVTIPAGTFKTLKTLSTRTKRTSGLMEFIRGRLDSSSVLVTNVRDGQYETDGKAYLGLKRDARDILPTLPR